MALTAGLLLFLAIDSIEESIEVSNENLANSFNGTLLVATVTVLSFLALYYLGNKIVSKADSLNFSKPVAIGLMISIELGYIILVKVSHWCSSWNWLYCI